MNYFILFMASIGVAIIKSMMELRTINSIDNTAYLVGGAIGLFAIPIILVFIGRVIDGSFKKKETHNKWMFTWIIWGIVSAISMAATYAENTERLSELSTANHKKSAVSASTKYHTYALDDLYNAVFPGSPILEVNTDQEGTRLRTYSYTDEINLIVYTASSAIEKTASTNIDITDVINNFINGEAHSVEGTIIEQKEVSINGSLGASYLIEYKVNGRTVRKYSFVTYNNGSYYKWSVQDIPTASKLNAADIFNVYVQFFSVSDAPTSTVR